MSSVVKCRGTADEEQRSSVSTRSGRDVKHERPADRADFGVESNDDEAAGSVADDGRRESRACRWSFDEVKTGKQQCNVPAPGGRVIDKSTFKRLKSKAVVVTAEDRRKIAEDLMAARERLENESAARKQKLRSYDTLRTKGKRLAQVKQHIV